MHKDFLDKLVEHGNGQLVEVLILVNQSDKTVSVLFVLLVALDSLFQIGDFNGKLGLFLFVLSVQSRDLLQFCWAICSPGVWRSGADPGRIRGNPQT